MKLSAGGRAYQSVIRQTTKHNISVTLTRDIQLDARELSYLRRMAQHCVTTQMYGAKACERLDKLLAGMGVAMADENFGPVYGLFEDQVADLLARTPR